MIFRGKYIFFWANNSLFYHYALKKSLREYICGFNFLTGVTHQLFDSARRILYVNFLIKFEIKVCGRLNGVIKIYFVENSVCNEAYKARGTFTS